MTKKTQIIQKKIHKLSNLQVMKIFNIVFGIFHVHLTVYIRSS